MPSFSYDLNTRLDNHSNAVAQHLGSLEGGVCQWDMGDVSNNERFRIIPTYIPSHSYIPSYSYQDADYENNIKSGNGLQNRHIKSFRQAPRQSAIKRNLNKDAQDIAVRVVTAVTGAVTQGTAQMVIDGNAWRTWGLEKAQEWGWNDSKFGQACGMLLSAASLAGGALVGAVRGSWEGGKQAYQSYQAGQGVWPIIKQSFSNAFYASEPTRFGTAQDANPLPLCQGSISSTVPSSADLLQRRYSWD